MRTQTSRQNAFSLLELLAVILIIGIVSVFVTPSVATIVRGSQLSQAEQILTDQIKLARQYAVTKNRTVQVRFIRYGDPETPGEQKTNPASGNYRAMQIFEVLDSGAAVPLDKAQVFPQAIVFNRGNLSTLLSDPSAEVKTATNNDPAMSRGVDRSYQYVKFLYLRDGGTDLKSTGGTAWCVTLQNINDPPAGDKLPANFVTVQVDPVSGSMRIFRPSLP